MECGTSLVPGAKASIQLQPFMEITEEDWDLDIHTNLYGQMRVARMVGQLVQLSTS